MGGWLGRLPVCWSTPARQEVNGILGRCSRRQLWARAALWDSVLGRSQTRAGQMVPPMYFTFGWSAILPSGCKWSCWQTTLIHHAPPPTTSAARRRRAASVNSIARLPLPPGVYVEHQMTECFSPSKSLLGALAPFDSFAAAGGCGTTHSGGNSMVAHSISCSLHLFGIYPCDGSRLPGGLLNLI